MWPQLGVVEVTSSSDMGVAGVGVAECEVPSRAHADEKGEGNWVESE